jgi:hypothetical protein
MLAMESAHVRYQFDKMHVPHEDLELLETLDILTKRLGWTPPSNDIKLSNEDRSRLYGSKGLGQVLSTKAKTIPTAKDENRRIKQEKKRVKAAEEAKLRRQLISKSKSKSATQSKKGKERAQADEVSDVDMHPPSNSPSPPPPNPNQLDTTGHSSKRSREEEHEKEAEMEEEDDAEKRTEDDERPAKRPRQDDEDENEVGDEDGDEDNAPSPPGVSAL